MTAVAMIVVAVALASTITMARAMVTTLARSRTATIWQMLLLTRIAMIARAAAADDDAR